MDENLGLIPDSALIYIPAGQHESGGVSKDDYVKEYEHWHLILQPKDRRERRGAGAGLLIAKRKVVLPTDLTSDEWAELSDIMNDAPRALSEAVSATFTGHFVSGFNNGALAGQTQAQVHIHIYPVIEEDLPKPDTRNGMGAMAEFVREKGK
jgi:diadenosine tetraphosphate (Ap4A) HIT family hydrolase